MEEENLGDEEGFNADLPDETEQTLVRLRTGRLPILITSCHGGSQSQGNAKWQWQMRNLRKRAHLNQKVRFSTVPDQGTLYLAGSICRELHRPWYVGATFARSFIDANRSLEDDAVAEGDERSKRMYLHYHAQIMKAVENILKVEQHRVPLLLDIHGHASDRFSRSVLLGTGARRNGTTLWAGDISHFYDQFVKVLDEELKEAGYDGVYPNSPIQEEEDDYSGGFTICNPNLTGLRLNRVQLEFPMEMRKNKERRDEVATRVARAVYNYIKYE